jgi:formate dehydrogenase iron-sulfur subunit
MSLARSASHTAAILVDVTRCHGCEKCVAACVAANGLDAGRAESDRATTPDGLSAYRFTTLVPLDNGRFARKSCMHCLQPSCVAACLVGGLEKTPEGAVVYDSEKCIGCRYCMLACPFSVPRYEWEKPIPYMRKCSLCLPRLRSGSRPACVEACPHDALSFGARSEMLATARSRIGLRPDLYLGDIWGEAEWGGTSVLYISDVDLSPLGLSPARRQAIPAITDPVIHSTPLVAASVAATVTGLRWIIRRRQLVQGREAPFGEGGDRDGAGDE